jgi:hypothetical protein
MATKKIKRFESGGVSDKDRGLEASKEDKVGFFERLRMGNIDEEGSEAYNRFGAGRGKADRTLVEDRVGTPVARGSGEVQDSEKQVSVTPLGPDSKNNSVISSLPDRPKARPGEPGSNVKIGGRPSIGSSVPENQTQNYSRTSGGTGERPKPDTSAPAKSSAYPMTKAQPTAKTYDRTGGPTADELANYRNTRSLASQIPDSGNPSPTKGEKVEPMSDAERNLQNILAATGVAGGAAGAIYKGKKLLDARKAAQAGAKKRANLKRDVEEGIERNLGDEVKNYSASAAEKAIAAKQRADKTLNPNAWMSGPKGMADDFKRGGKVKKMASGGMVSSASKRADGIATKGKTRCKMR